MKLADIPNVTAMAHLRAELVEKVRVVEQWNRNRSGGFGVVIGSQYQDDALVLAAMPDVLAELNARIASIDAELETLGVDTTESTNQENAS